MNKAVRYLGKTVPIMITIDETVKTPVLNYKEDHFELTMEASKDELIEKAVKSYYQKFVKKTVNEMIAKYQPLFKVKPRKITIETSLTKWGTCNSNRDLMFNWQLATVPLEVIEYIVVHEMCHMDHMNHDRSFWRLVGKLVPDYKVREAWLKGDI
ncbi:MAG: M48 family metallopeptidase [Clostridiales bacterium]|nr:M48 family metallopeptidase [Clostridiales bacterium]